MPEFKCPHCGVVHSQSAETNCRVCNGRLDFAGFAVDTSTVIPKRGRRDLHAIAIFAVSILLVRTAISIGYGNRAEALSSGVVAILLSLGLLAWPRVPSETTASARSDRQLNQRRRFLVLFMVGASLYFCLRWARVNVSQADITGTVEAGEYRNRYFHFRVPYGSTWVNTTALATEQFDEKQRGQAVQSTVLLSVALVPGENQEVGDSLVFIAEPLSSRSRVSSGHDFLVESVPELQNEWVSSSVQWGRRQMIAGLTFDRVTVKRLVDKHEFKMTFWATVDQGYALMIWGAFNSDKGLQSMEELLSRVSEFE